MVSLQKLVDQELISKKKGPAIKANGESKAESKSTKSRVSKKTANSIGDISADEWRQMIATNAYFRAQSRGFSQEGEEADWLAAEAEINASIGSSRN